MAQQQLQIVKSEPLGIVKSEPLDAPAEKKGLIGRYVDAVNAPIDAVKRGIGGVIRTITNPNAYPSLGAIGGGIVGMGLGGPLGAVAGAGLGGGLGKGSEIMAREARGEAVPKNPLADMAKRGVGEAALQVGGGLAGKALQTVGRGAYRFALRPQNAVTKKYGADAIIDEGLDQGIVVRKGQDRAANLVRTRKAEKDALVDAAGSRVSVSVPRVADDTAQGLYDDAQKLRRANKGDPTEYFEQQAKGLVAENPRGIPPSGLEELKRTVDSRTGGAHRKIRANEPLTPEEMWDVKFAKTAGDTLENIVPGYRGMNDGIMRAFGLNQAIRARTGSSAANNGLENLATIFMGPAAVPARIAATPRVASTLGIGADRLGKATERGFAQAVRAAMLARLAGQDKE